MHLSETTFAYYQPNNELNLWFYTMESTSYPSPPAKHFIETAKNATIPNAGTTTTFKGYIV
jgi:hypothetical protein